MRDTSSNGFGDLPASLRRATELLRQSPAPSDEWRERLLRAVERETQAREARESAGVTLGDRQAPSRARAEAHWSLRPLTAMAAGLACALVGGGAVAIVLRGGDLPAPVASVGLHAPVASPVAAPPAVGAGVPSTVRFTLVAPNASSVSLVGDFNGWNPAALPLRRGANGTWEVEVPLPAGRYAYAFYVDGVLARDPDAPKARDDDYGSVNSVVMVRGAL